MKITFAVKNVTVEIDLAECVVAAVAIIKFVM